MTIFCHFQQFLGCFFRLFFSLFLVICRHIYNFIDIFENLFHPQGSAFIPLLVKKVAISLSYPYGCPTKYQVSEKSSERIWKQIHNEHADIHMILIL